MRQTPAIYVLAFVLPTACDLCGQQTDEQVYGFYTVDVPLLIAHKFCLLTRLTQADENKPGM